MKRLLMSTWGLFLVLVAAVALHTTETSAQAVHLAPADTQDATPTVPVTGAALDAPTSSVPEPSTTHEITSTRVVTIYIPFTTKGPPDLAHPTPSPTPTPLPPGVHVLTNHTAYEDDGSGRLHILGEVFNNTSIHLRNVRVDVSILDEERHLSDDAYAYTYLDNLPAGQTTCFHVQLETPSNWIAYRFADPIPTNVGRPLPALTLVEHSGSYDTYFGWYEITGRVRNDELTTVEWVSPVGTLYDAQGGVVGCAFTYVNEQTLAGGETGTFEILYLLRDYADVAGYRIQIDGEITDRRAR